MEHYDLKQILSVEPSVEKLYQAMKIYFKYLFYVHLVTIINFVKAGDCDGEFENEIETFCSGEEIKIVLSECLIEKHGIYAPEYYLSGNCKSSVRLCRDFHTAWSSLGV